MAVQAKGKHTNTSPLVSVEATTEAQFCCSLQFRVKF